jgi:hypothetical protein
LHLENDNIRFIVQDEYLIENPIGVKMDILYENLFQKKKDFS